MNRGTKIMAASVVLGSGAIVALLFRQEPPQPDPQAPRNFGQLVLRKATTPLPVESYGSEAPLPTEPNSDAPSPARDCERTTIVTLVEQEDSPPSLPRNYPATNSVEDSRWGTAIGLTFPQRNGSSPEKRTHKVVDGDTLRSLARRYLGSADRHGEIFEVNKQLLSDPELLPIGAKLTIPVDTNPAQRD